MRYICAVLLFMGAAVIPGSTSAQDSEVKKHSVWIWQETGDCLWNIAKKYYGDPFKWKYIYEANRDIISDPRVIFPKQILRIPSLEEIRRMQDTLSSGGQAEPVQETGPEEEEMEEVFTEGMSGEDIPVWEEYAVEDNGE